jgi:hypothetical protein
MSLENATQKTIPTMVTDSELVDRCRCPIIESAVVFFIHESFHLTTTREIPWVAEFPSVRSIPGMTGISGRWPATSPFWVICGRFIAGFRKKNVFWMTIHAFRRQ